MTAIGQCEPFSEAWLSQLDNMTKDQALDWIDQHILASIRSRNRYEAALTTLPGAINAWIIDNNNILRFKRLYNEIASED